VPEVRYEAPEGGGGDPIVDLVHRNASPAPPDQRAMMTLLSSV
jgi:hypothetical protein